MSSSSSHHDSGPAGPAHAIKKGMTILKEGCFGMKSVKSDIVSATEGLEAVCRAAGVEGDPVGMAEDAGRKVRPGPEGSSTGLRRKPPRREPPSTTEPV